MDMESSSSSSLYNVGAAEAAIASSQQTRAAALEGRRSIRGRSFQLEERLRRAQVINFTQEDEEGLGFGVE